MSERSRRPSVTAIVLASVGAAAVAAICTVLIVSPIVPASLHPASEPELVPITMSDFADPQNATLTVETGQAIDIVAPRDGRVTAFNCARGATLNSGGTSLAIDGSPVLTLATSVPLWRSLQRGDEGIDVESIRSEMLRIGAPASTPGELDGVDIRAFDGLVANIGADPSDEASIDVGSILWTPRDAAVIATCAITLGATVSTGETIASLTADVTRVTVSGIPGTVREGDRELILDDTRIPVTMNDGAITDAAALAAIQGSPTYQRLLGADGDKNQLTANLSLVVPLEVASVPAGSIVGITGTAGCVVANGSPIKIEIVGSQLGQTYVAFKDKAPSQIERSPDKATTCR